MDGSEDLTFFDMSSVSDPSPMGLDSEPLDQTWLDMLAVDDDAILAGAAAGADEGSSHSTNDEDGEGMGKLGKIGVPNKGSAPPTKGFMRRKRSRTTDAKPLALKRQQVGSLHSGKIKREKAAAAARDLEEQSRLEAERKECQRQAQEMRELL